MAGRASLTQKGGSSARDALAAGPQEPAPRRTAAGDRRRRCDVDERAQYEGALVHAWMRYDELRLGKAAPPVEQQIEVEHARRVAPLTGRSPPTMAVLDDA